MKMKIEQLKFESIECKHGHAEDCNICNNEEKLKALEQLLEYSFWITLNANDFFGLACAAVVELDIDNLKWVLPIITKYGDDGIHAVMSYVDRGKPIEKYVTKEFKKAYKEIKKLDKEKKIKVWRTDE